MQNAVDKISIRCKAGIVPIIDYACPSLGSVPHRPVHAYRGPRHSDRSQELVADVTVFCDQRHIGVIVCISIPRLYGLARSAAVIKVEAIQTLAAAPASDLSIRKRSWKSFRQGDGESVPGTFAPVQLLDAVGLIVISVVSTLCGASITCRNARAMSAVKPMAA